MIKTDIFDALVAFQAKEDGTYNLISQRLVEYPLGFQVSFVRKEAFEQLTHEDWNTLTEHYSAYLESEPHIGVFNGDAEISFHAMDRVKADQTMEEFNQESILDWKSKNDYPDDIDRWFIINLNFNPEKVVNYDEVLKRIQQCHSALSSR